MFNYRKYFKPRGALYTIPKPTTISDGVELTQNTMVMKGKGYELVGTTLNYRLRNLNEVNVGELLSYIGGQSRAPSRLNISYSLVVGIIKKTVHAQ